MLRCRAGCRCHDRRSAWTGCRRPSKVDSEIIELGKVHYCPSRIQVLALDYITRLNKWQFRRKRQVRSEDDTLPLKLNIVDGIGSLLHRRYTQHFTHSSLRRTLSGRVDAIPLLREPLLIISQCLCKRGFELHVATIQVPGIHYSHRLKNVATLRCLDKYGNPGGCVV